jgi:hypothetical protein
MQEEQEAMILGRTLMGSTSAYHSEWQTAAGSSAVFALEVLAIGANTDFTIVIETKNENETDAQIVSIEELAPISTTGVTVAVASGIKQFVRLRYVVGGSGSLRFVHFRWLKVTWRP